MRKQPPASIQTDSYGLASVLSRFGNKSNSDFSGKLTDSQIEQLFRTSNIVQKVIKKYPKEAKGLGYQLLDEKGRIIESNDEQLLLAFQEASIYARLYGKAFLYLNLDDTSDDLPVRKNAKLQGWEVHFDLVKTNDFYDLVDAGGYTSKVHYTRIIEFIGARTYAKNAKPSDTEFSESVLQSIYESLENYISTNDNARYIVSNLSYLSVGIDNLGAMTRTDEGKKNIFERLTTLNINRSINRTLAYDKKSENIGFITQQLLGVTDVVEKVREIFVSNTDYPFEQIFEQAPNIRFGSSGIQNQLVARYLWAQRVRNWVITNWMPYYSVYFNRVRDMRNIKIHIPFIVDKTEQEQAEIEKLAAERTKLLIDAGVLSVDEARGAYRNNDFTLNIELKDEVFAKQSSSLIKEPELTQGTKEFTRY